MAKKAPVTPGHSRIQVLGNETCCLGKTSEDAEPHHGNSKENVMLFCSHRSGTAGSHPQITDKEAGMR